MDQDLIIQKLESNSTLYKSLLENISIEQSTWKPNPNKWSILGIVNHILDEEKWDFKQRMEFALEIQQRDWKRIEPIKWAEEERYNSGDLSKTLTELLGERKSSIEWLKGLDSPDWKSLDNYPGTHVLTAEQSLANWLAHDYLHIRQINKMNWLFLSNQIAKGTDLNYAGEWYNN